MTNLCGLMLWPVAWQCSKTAEVSWGWYFFDPGTKGSGSLINVCDENNTITHRVKEAIAIKQRKPSLNRYVCLDLPPIYNPLLEIQNFPVMQPFQWSPKNAKWSLSDSNKIFVSFSYFFALFYTQVWKSLSNFPSSNALIRMFFWLMLNSAK